VQPLRVQRKAHSVVDIGEDAGFHRSHHRVRPDRDVQQNLRAELLDDLDDHVEAEFRRVGGGRNPYVLGTDAERDLLPDVNLALFILGLLAVRHRVLDEPRRHVRLIAGWMTFGALACAEMTYSRNNSPSNFRAMCRARVMYEAAVEAIGKDVVAKSMGIEDAALRRAGLRPKTVPPSKT